MKKTMFVPVLSAVLLLLSTANAKAQQASSLPELNIEFAGKVNNQPMFRVGYNKAPGEVYTLSISDAQGYVFYEERFKDAVYTKKFLLDPETEISELIVTISDRKGEKKTYRINTKVSQVYDMVVTRN